VTAFLDNFYDLLAGLRAGRAGERLCEALFARILDGEFSAPDDGERGDDRAGCAAVDTVFYGSGDLCGLIWEAVDQWDHPLLAYETARDFRNCQLSFRWRSSGIRALDLVNGPTLTIEGRDAGGSPRSWYVRLWNYASGSPTDATITLDFNTLNGGYLLPSEADPVWAGDVDRMFISLVPPAMTREARNMPPGRQAGSS
jgi:hypothetical protein